MSRAEAREAETALESKINRIWTLLSAFEESSAACISDMLLHVSNGAYIEGSLMAARFIVHVEVLFGAIDRLDSLSINAAGHGTPSRNARIKGRSSIPERIQIVVSENCQFLLPVEQDLRSRSTATRDYTGTIKSCNRTSTLSQDLDSASVNHITPTGITLVNIFNTQEQDHNDTTALGMFLDTLGNLPSDPPQPEQGINPTSDSCQDCSITIEESCLRYTAIPTPDRRWHTSCLKCSLCRRPLVADQALWSETGKKVICITCSSKRAVQKDFPDRKPGFERITLLMQFIFLLRVALARLGSILRDNKALPHTSGTSTRDNGN